MEEFRETELNGVKLQVYRDGTIWRYVNKTQKGYIQGWHLCNLKPGFKGYVKIMLNYKSYKVHRIIGMVYLGLDINDPNKQIDHINRCKTNNNVNNLQIVTNSENHFNKEAKGYSWNIRNKKWMAYISVNKKRKHLGYFDNEEDARNAYLEAKAKYHVINHHPHPQEI
jgi:hypothetical protein